MRHLCWMKLAKDKYIIVYPLHRIFFTFKFLYRPSLAIYVHTCQKQRCLFGMKFFILSACNTSIMLNPKENEDELHKMRTFTYPDNKYVNNK